MVHVSIEVDSQVPAARSHSTPATLPTTRYAKAHLNQHTLFTYLLHAQNSRLSQRVAAAYQLPLLPAWLLLPPLLLPLLPPVLPLLPA
jgi:hypothetical protein